jgi:hypothetical protein
MGNNFADRNGGTLSYDVSNQNRRKRAQTQIVDDNKKLLRQILSARTAYSRSQYSEEEHKRLQLRRNVSKHPQHRTAGDSMSGLASVNQLPTHTRTSSDKLQRYHSSSELRSSGSHGASLVDEEVHSASPTKIRLAATTHLKKHGVKQRPVSASASSTNSPASSLYDSSAWHAAASPESRRLCPKRGSESVEDQLRAMVINQQNDCDSDGDGEARRAAGEAGE